MWDSWNMLVYCFFAVFCLRKTQMQVRFENHFLRSHLWFMFTCVDSSTLTSNCVDRSVEWVQEVGSDHFQRSSDGITWTRPFISFRSRVRGIVLDQGLANCGPQVTSGPLPVPACLWAKSGCYVFKWQKNQKKEYFVPVTITWHSHLYP